MRRTMLLFLAITLLVAIAVPASGQGITAMLERLDSLEQQMSTMGTTLSEIKGGGSVGAEQDFSAFDETLAEIESQLGQLKDEVSAIPEPVASTGMDPDLENRIVQLEQKNQELVPLLHELQSEQKSGFAEIKASLQGAPVVVSPVAVSVSSGCEAADTSDEFVLTGFVDASYFYDGATGYGSFGLDQVEIDIERSVGADGSLRVDLEWVSDGEGGFTPEVEQGFVTISPDFAGEGAFTFGKFNAPIGFELLDAPDMFQYSHALVFNAGLPTNLTGVMYNVPFSAQWDLAAYVCNGWDTNVDADKDKTVGGRLGFAGGTWGGGFSAIHGTETPDTTGTKLTVFDVDLYFDPSENWTMGGELNFGDHDLGDTSATWWGFLVMSHWDFNPTVGGTIRFDYFDDQDASRLGGEVPEVRKAVAIAPTFALGAGMGALIEARWDFSSEDVFTDSDHEPSDSAWAFAFEMTYTF